MKSNSDLKELAWKRLWADHWFGRLFGGGFLLGIAGYAVNTVLRGILGRLGVQSWFDYLGAVAQNRQDVTTPIPNLTPAFVSQANSSTVLTMFFSFIMAGIASYGAAVILKKCLANDDRDWLREAFGGFRCPFGMLWLQLRYWLIYVFWGFVGLFPLGLLAGACYPVMESMIASSPVLASVILALALTVGLSVAILVFCIPFYRYRFLFLVKAEHPEWGAGDCIRACRQLMRGRMLTSFRLDCSYWKAITLMLLPLLVLALAAAVGALAGGGKLLLLLLGAIALLCLVVSVPLAVVVGQYISVGQGFLYLELKDGQEK